MTRESVEFAKTLRLHNGIETRMETGIDDLINLRHEVETLREQLARCMNTDHATFYHIWRFRAEEAETKLAAANERNRTLADDLAGYALKNAALEVDLKREMYTAAELRLQLLLANRDAAGHPRPSHLAGKVSP